MKRFIWIPILSAVLAALSAFAVVKWQQRVHPAAGVDQANDVNWLKKELDLTPGQTLAVEAIARAYREELTPCNARHCTARCGLSSVIFRNGVTDAELESAISELTQAQLSAERATLRYFRKLHAALTPTQQARFETLILRCVCQEHSGQPGQCQPPKRPSH